MADLKFYIVTFNCGRQLVEAKPFADHLLDGWEDPDHKSTDLPDLIVLTLQEFAPLSYAFLTEYMVKSYFDRFREVVSMAIDNHHKDRGAESSEFVNVLAKNSGLTAIMIFARKSSLSSIAELKVAEVGVGPSEMASKGAVGARIAWESRVDGKRTQVTFVAAHLAPSEASVHLRDQNYLDIVKGLVFSTQDAREWRKEQASDEDVPLLNDESADEDSSSTGSQGMYSDNSYLFFSGDLNYRTASKSPSTEDRNFFPQPTQDTNSAVHYHKLLEKDQLQQELRQGKTLHGLTEQPIDFPPTYKYQLDADKPVLKDEDLVEWKWAQHRWPSWCDRILFSRTEAMPVNAGRYSALPIFRTSDHRPVALSVSIPSNPITGSAFSKEAPVSIDNRYHQRRVVARRLEIVVGVATYLGLTWEGNSLLLGTLLLAVGSTFVFKPSA